MMSSSVIHLAVASDARYLTGAIGTLSSIRLAVPLEFGIRVIFLHDRLSQEEQQRVHRAMAKLKRGAEVEFMRVDDCFASFPAFSFGSNMAYARLVLPEKVVMERLIYIDVDILVLKDLSELLFMELPATGVGGVAEKIIAEDMPEVQPVALDPEQPYLNSGLLVLDLNKLRRTGVFAKALEILRNYPESCRWHDQSAINYALNGEARVLDPSWNVQSQYFFFDPIEVMPRLAERSVNVHFTSKAKPWLAPTPFPAEQMFRMLLDVVDPGWREDPYVKTSMWKAKERYAAVMPWLFRGRAMCRKLIGKDGFWDLREAQIWARHNKNLGRMSEQAGEISRLREGWQAQIEAAMAGS
jgi:lipopolysaccharide biosynthesis glycosyltransferase